MVTLVEPSRVYDRASANSSFKLEERLLAVESEINHRDQRDRSKLFTMRPDSEVVAWSIKDLRPADVPVDHSFDLTDKSPIHHYARGMSPINNESEKRLTILWMLQS